ncbi:hypothetical protein Pcinc_009821 [Petrolisthes cinctipes]|uniref:SWIM-type domain-containing protein n=1 Tax=Petrolisthes cinctipes TaxID=88211 RepID=A0AAE1G671_PETCI|nr:hypothetical protein Pcinc_009821 [Petrolisthes cinctipes]
MLLLLVPSRPVGEDYGDDAVGYVQLQRKDGMCEIAARITPEYRITTKPYRVVAVINEKEEEILEVKCQDCAAAQVPCKHAAAFVWWLLRRSGEKSVNSVKSYWKKARLSNVTIETKSTSLVSLKEKARRSSAAVQDIGEQFFKEVLALPSQSGLIYDYYGNNPQHLELLGIDQLLQAFYKEQTGVLTSDGFLLFCKVKTTSDICKLIEKETVISLTCFEISTSNCIKSIVTNHSCKAAPRGGKLTLNKNSEDRIAFDDKLVLYPGSG